MPEADSKAHRVDSSAPDVPGKAHGIMDLPYATPRAKLHSLKARNALGTVTLPLQSKNGDRHWTLQRVFAATASQGQGLRHALKVSVIRQRDQNSSSLNSA